MTLNTSSDLSEILFVQSEIMCIKHQVHSRCSINVPLDSLNYKDVKKTGEGDPVFQGFTYGGCYSQSSTSLMEEAG